MNNYRVATAHSYDTTINRLQQRQAQLADTQDQLSSGKRVRRISDDPAAAALAEREQARMKRIQADQRALEASRRSLELAESTLGTITDLYQRAKELIVQGGNGALNDSDRRTIAQELDGIREQILELSNTKDTLGKPLFMGLGVVNSLGRPFVEDLISAATTTYGSDGRLVKEEFLRGQTAATGTALPAQVDGYEIFSGRLAETVSAIAAAVTTNTAMPIDVQVEDVAVALNSSPSIFTLDDSITAVGEYTLTYQAATSDWLITGVDNTGAPLAPRTVAGNTLGDVTELAFDGLRVRLQGALTDGDSFTVTPTVDTNVWETFDRAIGALSRGEKGYDLSQELAVVNTHLEARLDRLQSARGQLGDWLNRADQMEASFQERENYHVEQQSELTDLDMLEAISRFQTQQLGYQAGLQSYAQIQRQSLFQYLA